ncbi:MAG: YoaK family protein [Ilumatobacteraceae bacterium]
MPSESTHHIGGPLTTAIGLALTAGYVDAFVYRNVFPVFVANMSGNLVRTGMSIGDLDLHAVFASLLAIAAFAVGVSVATTMVDRQVGRGQPLRPEPLARLEVVLLVLVSAIALRPAASFSDRLTPTKVVVVALASAAMGVQAIGLRKVGQVAVSTTYGTGAIVRLGEKLSLALRRSPHAHTIGRRHSVRVLATVLASYVAGAALASALPDRRWLLAAAPSLMLVVAHWLHDDPEPALV